MRPAPLYPSRRWLSSPYHCRICLGRVAGVRHHPRSRRLLQHLPPSGITAVTWRPASAHSSMERCSVRAPCPVQDSPRAPSLSIHDKELQLTRATGRITGTSKWPRSHTCWPIGKLRSPPAIVCFPLPPLSVGVRKVRHKLPHNIETSAGRVNRGHPTHIARGKGRQAGGEAGALAERRLVCLGTGPRTAPPTRRDNDGSYRQRTAPHVAIGGDGLPCAEQGHWLNTP